MLAALPEVVAGSHILDVLCRRHKFKVSFKEYLLDKFLDTGEFWGQVPLTNTCATMTEHQTPA